MQTKINLDETCGYNEIDPKNLLETVEHFPEQCEASLKICKNISVNAFSPSNTVIFGMGGSGAGGDLLQVLMLDKLNIPLQCFHNYDIPEFVSHNSLALIISYSGNTQETLKAYENIKTRNSKIIVITSGGSLLQKAINDNIPHIKIPTGYQPRAALGFLFFPLIYTLYKMKIIENPEKEISETIDLLKKQKENFSRDIPVSSNQAKQLAQKLSGTIPLIYSSRYYLDPVAKRWKTQINENAKILAHQESFPELCHNTICGWDKNSRTKNYSVIMLRTQEEDKPTKIRIEYLKEIILEKNNILEEIIAVGKSKMEEILSTIYLGDFVSMYLALFEGTDPSKIKRINALKERL